jgi:hypothetical protein
MRLDEEKLEALRTWGERLRQSGGEEAVAVGRAILMLVEEIDRLHIDLWHARMQPGEQARIATEDPTAEEGEGVGSSLHARLQRVLRRSADPSPQPVERAGNTETDKKVQAWIDGLRRQG